MNSRTFLTRALRLYRARSTGRPAGDSSLVRRVCDPGFVKTVMPPRLCDEFDEIVESTIVVCRPCR